MTTFTNMFIPTTKQTPSDAVLPSHKYLIQGAFINQQGAGLYNYLPLGKIVLDKIRTIVKDELDKAKCNEIQLSFVTPMGLWEQSGRAEDMGKEMLRIKDRHNNDFVLSPTNEEAVVTLVKNRVKSYKDLPLNLYQINTKFRDEARPRYGLLRAREFLMKDGYSFHSTKDDMVREFNLMEKTYKNIFTRLGVDFRVVQADSGAIGGDGSKEFHILANSGEDTLVVCKKCEFGANIETMFDDEKINELSSLSYEELQTQSIEQKCSCKNELIFKKGIEIGHIFQLGDKYSKALNATFLDENGKSKPFEMATFGIGVSRLISAIIEQNHDSKGCIWTQNTAPFFVDIVVSNGKNEDEQQVAQTIAKQLYSYDIEYIIDDRKKERFGFKMADFELIGFPYAIVVGKKIKDSLVEIINRKTLQKIEINIDKVANKLKEFRG